MRKVMDCGIIYLHEKTRRKNMEEKKFNKTAYDNEFIKKNYDRINLTVPKGHKELIKAHAEKKGKSVNSYINDLIEKDMQSG